MKSFQVSQEIHPELLIRPAGLNKSSFRSVIFISKKTKADKWFSCDSCPREPRSHRSSPHPPSSLRTPPVGYRGLETKLKGKIPRKRGVVRGCLTKGVDKFYAETVKRVSSWKKESVSRGGRLDHPTCSRKRVEIFPSKKKKKEEECSPYKITIYHINSQFYIENF